VSTTFFEGFVSWQSGAWFRSGAPTAS